MDSPNSELSDYASDDFPEDVKGRPISYEHTPDHEPSGRPNKRLRLAGEGRRATSDPPHVQLPAPGEGEISDDTDGSVPASPHHPGMSAEDDYGQEQVTVCKWENCDAGDLGNMDRLVDHLHDDHIGTRQKKYSCEWIDCSRKGIPHASGYALRAHMRSHTREKPFYCTLPECDRSFTRSDALAKHMRTVHETEALRPSDPVPKHHSSNPSNKFQRLRLVLNATKDSPSPASPSSHPPNSATVPKDPSDLEYANNNVVFLADPASPTAPPMLRFPEDAASQLAQRELAMPADELFKLLRRQLHWAQQESEELKAEAERLEKVRKEEWVAKELALENYMEGEFATMRRRRIDRGMGDETELWEQLAPDVEPAKLLHVEPKAGKLPWWRDAPWARPHEEPIQGLHPGVPEEDGAA